MFSSTTGPRKPTDPATTAGFTKVDKQFGGAIANSKHAIAMIDNGSGVTLPDYFDSAASARAIQKLAGTVPA